MNAFLTGVLFAGALWGLLYGTNILWRLLLERRHRNRHEVVAEYRVWQGQTEESWSKGLSIWPLGAVIGLILGDGAFAWGIFAGTVLVLAGFWPFYKKSKTVCSETVMFDRDGIAFFPPRQGFVHQGIFKARIDWQDVYGYSAHKGSILFALRPLGHVEQHYGPYRREFSDVLNRLDVQKLVAFDVVDEAEARAEDLQLLERDVFAVAEDVVSGYKTEAAGAGVRLEPKVLYGQEAEEGELVGGHAYLHIGVWDGETCLRELEWMIWERSDGDVEVLSLPRERLYEILDERLEAVLEERLGQLGVEAQPAVLQ